MDDLHALMSKNIIRPYLHLPHLHVSNDVFCTVVLSFYKVVVLALFSVVQLSFLELYIYILVSNIIGEFDGTSPVSLLSSQCYPPP